ncbi:MAG: DUF4347 domain-containing protein [Acaryochloris sp. RU_4_1]|nr:DUF4347 domain-containing protein [Acaryochloris sp. SU_5_25]NJM65934.1 DUF4347 domain-containing protein [Acaryochloris sp. RU_4_1]NJN37696.1 DUF4347 domain-containing protein [Acaryochloridaceae cyanobacterium CSU_3_4]NJR55557.1 DUF4347 domain-containing protein [Acaryochloris sp. CRU_2_0]
MPLPIQSFCGSSSEATALPKFCQNSKAIVVVDAAIKNYSAWLTHSLEDLEVHRLNDQEEGIAQIQMLLHHHQRLDCLHLICEGAPGQMVLGTTQLSEANLWVYADELRQWRDYLVHDAEILIYGCDLAANRVGQAFVSWLELLTGVCVRVLGVTTVGTRGV